MAIFEQRRTAEFVETDLAGIVHFSNFFRWMEAAENAFLQSLGGRVVERVPEGFRGWPRVRASAKYQSPVRLGDAVCVALTVAEVKDRSVVYHFVIYVEAAAAATASSAESEARPGAGMGGTASQLGGTTAGRIKAATGELTVVYVEKPQDDAPMRPLMLPEGLRERLLAFQAA